MGEEGGGGVVGQVNPRTYDRLESDTSLGPLEQLLKRDDSFEEKKF